MKELEIITWLMLIFLGYFLRKYYYLKMWIQELLDLFNMC